MQIVNQVSGCSEINERKNVNLIYSIDEGRRYRINKVSLNADAIFDKNIFFPL